MTRDLVVAGIAIVVLVAAAFGLNYVAKDPSIVTKLNPWAEQKVEKTKTDLMKKKTTKPAPKTF
jgi:hypothetical protein